MLYWEEEQEIFYNERIGKIYGCFEVVSVKYDYEKRQQLWTLRCIHCGFEKQTYHGKDYVKGKNHGICKCQHTKKIPGPKAPKIRVEKPRTQQHELYSRWRSMVSRCHNENDKSYCNYGARGIAVCDDWKNNFMAFVRWAEANGYQKDLTIDRIDNNSGYRPDNCRWVSRAAQNKNKRNVKLYNGLTAPDYCLKHDADYEMVARRMNSGTDIDSAILRAKETKERIEFNKVCAEHGMDASTVRYRIQRGIPLEFALKTAGNIGKTGVIEINGVQKTLKAWCEEYGLTPAAVLYRVKKLGMTIEEAIRTPKAQGIKSVKRK